MYIFFKWEWAYLSFILFIIFIYLNLLSLFKQKKHSTSPSPHFKEEIYQFNNNKQDLKKMILFPYTVVSIFIQLTMLFCYFYEKNHLSNFLLI